MIQIGDRVEHTVFPPIEGVVTGIQPMVNNEPKVVVKRNDNGLLFWGMYSEWKVIEDNSKEEDDIIDIEYRELN